MKFKPQTSNKTVPPRTLAAQCDTWPLPLPIRTPVGLDVTGRSGKIFIQIFPFLFIFRTIACLEASICLAFIIPDSAAFSPTVPNFRSLSLNSNLESFPFLVFLYLVCFGPVNIVIYISHISRLLLQMFH